MHQCGNKAINRDYLEKYVFRLLADVLFDEERIHGVISEYNKAVLENDDDFSDEIKGLDKSIKKLNKEMDNIVTVIANTASTVLAQALAEKEKELAALKTERRELQKRRVTLEVDRSEIVKAFRKGRELLMTGEIPHLKQLIRLYVRRIEVFPDYVTVYLNYLPSLKSIVEKEQLDYLNFVMENALDVTHTVSRRALNYGKY